MHVFGVKVGIGVGGLDVGLGVSKYDNRLPEKILYILSHTLKLSLSKW